MTDILKVNGLTKRFGGLTAVSNSSFSIRKGEIFGIIGPNGAGKTTLFNLISGHYRPTAGKVAFNGEDITGKPSHWIGRHGIVRTFQSVHVFQEETVAENLRRATVLAQFHNPIAYVSPRKHRGTTQAIEDTARFVGLSNYLQSTAGTLAYGTQKILGIGMAMMVNPTLLLMDEPAAGLNPSEKKVAASLIRKLRDERDISVVVVEHDMALVMGTCDRILVVNQGSPIALGTPDEIKSDDTVIEAYLGEDYEFA